MRIPARILALKTLSYSAMHLMVAVSVAWMLTRDWRVALAVGMVEPVFQTLAFALHERAWSRVATAPVPVRVRP